MVWLASDDQLRLVRMFIKHCHLFCNQAGILTPRSSPWVWAASKCLNFYNDKLHTTYRYCHGNYLNCCYGTWSYCEVDFTMKLIFNSNNCCLSTISISISFSFSLSLFLSLSLSLSLSFFLSLCLSLSLCVSLSFVLSLSFSLSLCLSLFLSFSLSLSVSLSFYLSLSLSYTPR